MNPSKIEAACLADDLLVSFVPMEAVGEQGELELTQTRPLGDVRSGYTYFRDGDVVVAKITPCFENGKGALMGGLVGGLGFGTTEFQVLRPGSSLDARFLYYVTASREFRDLGEASMYGAAGQKRVSEEFIRNFQVRSLPLPTQRAIANFLDKKTRAIDDLIQKKERLIELLAEKRQALITQAVTKGLDPSVPMKDSGVEWLGEVPRHWEVHQLRRVVARFVDYRGRTPTKVDDGVPLITAGAIRDGVIDHARAPEFMERAVYREFMRRGIPEIGDVVFTSEAPLGEVALVEDTSVAFAQRVILFKVNKRRITGDFLWLYYCSVAGRSEVGSRASGSTAEGIRADRLRASAVPVPPVAEQREIASAVRGQLLGLSPITGVLRDQIDRLHEYRQALISAAVSGQIDVEASAA